MPNQAPSSPDKKTWLASMLGCALLGSIGGNIALSFADGQRDTSTITSGGLVVPYDGYVVLNSTPLDSSAQKMRFSLFQAPTGGSAVWIEEQDVSVYNGRFSVGIGKGTKDASITRTFDDVILDAEKTFLGIEIFDATSGQFVGLSGRQAIEAAPYSAWSASAADFDVEGLLKVNDAIRLTSALDNTGATAPLGISNGGRTMYVDSNEIDSTDTLYLQNNSKLETRAVGPFRGMEDAAFEKNVTVAGSAVVTNNIGVGQTLSATAANIGAYRPPYTSWSAHGTGQGGASIYNDNLTYKALMITGNTSGLSDRQIQLYDDVTVTKDLTVRDNLTVEDNLTVNGTLKGRFATTGEIIAQNNINNTTYVETDTGVSTSDGICFLTSVFTNHNSSDPAWNGCHIKVTNGKWAVEAQSNYNFADAEADCRARCIIFN